MPSKKRLEYKWIIVGACFVTVFLCLGFCSSVKGLYLSAVTEALGIPRAVYSINDSFRYAASTLLNLFFGVLVMKLGPRKMVAGGYLCLIASCLIYSLADSISVFYIGGFLLGVGIAVTGTSMVGHIVNIWCKENKGTVMGLILCANGLGGAVASQILSPIINNGVFGYRDSYRLTALLLALVGAIVFALLRDTPKEGSQIAAPGKKQAKSGAWDGITLKEALRRPYFYLAAVCILFTGMGLQSVSGIASAHMKDVGLNAAYVAAALSVHSVALAAFKFLTGIFYDRKGLRATMLVCYTAGVAMFLLLAFVSAGSTGRVLAMAYSVMSAVAMPLETIMLPLIAADLFGQKEFAKMVGIVSAINTVGYALSTPVSNLVFDLVGTYFPILIIYSVMLAAIAVAFLFVLRAAGKTRKALQEASAE